MSARRSATSVLALEPLELDRDLREDVLADDDERSAKAPRDGERDVGDDGRVGHAQDDVRLAGEEAGPERRGEIRDVVDRAQRQIAAVERRRPHAHDLDAVDESCVPPRRAARRARR